MSRSIPKWFLPAIACALWPAAASSNGGSSIYEYLGGGVGSIRPKRESAIRLISEDLAITLGGRKNDLDRAARDDPGAWRYSVHALYYLQNRGPAKSALYAVPVMLPAVPGDEELDSYSVKEKAEEIARGISITLNGAEHRCDFHAQPGTAVVPEDLHSGEELRADEMLLGEMVGKDMALAGYCVTPLEIPSGDEIQIELSYAGPLFSADYTGDVPKECDGGPERCAEGEAKKSCAAKKRKWENWERVHCHRPPTERTLPWLYYSLGAASSWAGRPNRVSVTVTLGGFSFDAKNSKGVPSDAVVKKGTLRWTWKEPSLAGMDFALALRVPGEKNAQIRSFNGTAADPEWCRPAGMTARASSSVAAQGENEYGAGQVLDGRGATAWCVNTKRNGVGEWIELEFRIDPRYSRVAALYVLPGYAKSQTSYEANGRVDKIRYGGCGQGAPLTEVGLPVSDDVFESVIQVPGAEEILAPLMATAGLSKVCVRVEIASVVPGKKFKDVCISEIVLPFRCH